MKLLAGTLAGSIVQMTAQAARLWQDAKEST